MYEGPSPILLHDSGPTAVTMDSCPWHGVDWSQERYLLNAYGHYKNGHLLMPLAEWPGWFADGIALLTHCDNVEMENKRNATK